MNNPIEYEKYRPDYPIDILTKLNKNACLANAGTIAEFGCGTGKFTTLLARTNKELHVFDSSPSMIEFCKNKFKKKDSITFYTESSSETSLNDKSVDLIFCAQSFHLFDQHQTINEFKRILKPNGIAILLWYHWDMQITISTEIRKLYYKYGKLSKQKNRNEITDDTIKVILDGFEVHKIELGKIDQSFNRQEFIESMTTSSYFNYIDNVELKAQYLKETEQIFNNFQINNEVNYSFDLIAYAAKSEL